jgi:glycosyltransferase involved in cell wall biosynthesis
MLSTSETPLRVLVCVPWGERLGGAEVMLRSLLKHTDPRRSEYRVAFLQSGSFVKEIQELGVHAYEVPAGRLRDAGAASAATRRLARIIRDEEPDVVLNWTTKSQLYGAVAAIRARCGDRVLWWQHGVSTGHWMDRAATALPAQAIGCSSRASAVQQSKTRPRRPTFVVHPGVETERVRPIARDELGIPEGRPLVGLVGRLQPGKGQHRFLASIRRLHEAGCHAHGLIVGGSAHGLSPGYEEEMRSLIPRLGLSGWVTMVGQVPDARPYIATMDVLVNATVHESFGIVLAEALAQGVPVVAAADGGPREIVKHGITGLLVPRPEASPLAAAVGELLGDELRRHLMAVAARRDAVERFGVDAMARALDSGLRSIAHGKQVA